VSMSCDWNCRAPLGGHEMISPYIFDVLILGSGRLLSSLTPQRHSRIDVVI
jgi:hypothetical protein